MKKRLAIIVCLLVAFLIGIAVGATIIGVININYTIEPFREPTILEPLTFEPKTVNLNLGTITAVLGGEKKFVSVATLTVPAKYEITVKLDRKSVSDFDRFYVGFEFRHREIKYAEYADVCTWYNYEIKETLKYAGIYDVDVWVQYTAKNVTATGTIVVILS